MLDRLRGRRRPGGRARGAAQAERGPHPARARQRARRVRHARPRRRHPQLERGRRADARLAAERGDRHSHARADHPAGVPRPPRRAPRRGAWTGARGDPRIFELELQRRDGTRFPAEATVSRVTARGEVFAAGFLRDVTDRLRREDEREALLREQAARAEAERVAEMVSGMQLLVDAALAHRTLDDILHRPRRARAGRARRRRGGDLPRRRRASGSRWPRRRAAARRRRGRARGLRRRASPAGWRRRASRCSRRTRRRASCPIRASRSSRSTR